MRKGSILYCLLILFTLTSLSSRAADRKDASLNIQGMPLVFEPSSGQGSADTRFIVHQPGLGAAFTPTSIDLQLSGGREPSSQLRLNLRGRSDVSLTGEQELASKTNYLRGNDPAHWQTGIPNFSRVRYSQLYKGIDLVFYGNGNQLEHDFVVSPGADPKQIGFDLSGARRIQLATNGDLLIDLKGGILRFKKPQAYQESEAGRIDVPVKFAMHKSRIAFEVGHYDNARTLVIDPVLSFATYLGGRTTDAINSVAVDSVGNIYVTGSTLSSDFPGVSPVQSSCASCVNFQRDAFVAKLDSTGHTLIYSTYLGGGSEDSGTSISVDSNGNAIVAGNSTSMDFPSLHPISIPSCCNNTWLFLTSLSPDGAHFNYSGFIGQLAFGLSTFAATLDSTGNAYVTGQTSSSTFPITAGTLSPSVPGYPSQTLFVTKVSPAGALVYSTVVPASGAQAFTGNNNNFAPSGIAVDSSGSAYVVGAAGNGLPTTAGVLALTFPGDNSNSTVAFALKLNPTASALGYATYIPGTTSASAVAVDTNGDAYIAGSTSSRALPVSANAFQKTLVAGKNCTCNSGYLLKLDPLGAQAPFATYFSGTPADSNLGTNIRAIALDNNANIYIAGSTASADLPLKNPLQSTAKYLFNPGTAFISEFNGDASGLLFSSFLGGSNGSYATGIAVDVAGKLVVAGVTQEVDFPTTAGAYQTASPILSTPGNAHGFIGKVDVGAAAPSVCLSQWSIAFGSILVNTNASKTVTLSNCGNVDLHVTNVVSSSPSVSATNTCSAPVIPGAFCTVDVTFAPTDTTPSSGKLAITTDAGIATQNITFSGKGGKPQLDFLPGTLVFPDVFVGTQSGQTSFNLKNIGDGALIITNIVALGDFSVSNTCSAPVTTNQSCKVSVTFSPTAAGPRTGTLAIADNVDGSPQMIQLSGSGITQYPVPAITSIRAIPTFGTGLVTVMGQNFFPTSTVFWNGTARPTTYLSQFSLLAQLNPADLAQLGEFPVTVTTGAPGGGVSNSVLATLYSQLKAGLLNQPVNDMVYDPHSQLIYASVPTWSATNVNSILVIDPALGTIVNTFPVGGSPGRLALSDDGQFLYVGLDGQYSVAQLSLPSGTVNFKAPLGSDSFYGGYVAAVIRVLPGQPHAYVVSLTVPNVLPGFRGVTVFDDSTPRSTAVNSTSIYPSTLLFLNSDTSTLYSSDTAISDFSFYRFNIGASGITLKDQTQSLAGTEIDTDGTLIYLANGKTIDPVTLATQTSFTFPVNTFSTALKVDSAAARVFFGTNSNVLAYDTNTHAALGSIQFPASGVSRLLRWGTNGLAFVSSSNVTLFRTGLTGTSATTTPTPGLTFSTTALSFANTWLGRSSPSQAVQVSNAGTGTVALNRISVTGDFLQNNNCGTTLAPGAVCSINVSFLPTSTGLRSSNVIIDANGGITTVSLSGQGIDLAITLARALRSRRSATPADLLATQMTKEVSITPVGLAGQVGLSCTSAPGTTCVISPSSFTASSTDSSPQQAKITVTQNRRAARLRRSEPGTGTVTMLVDAGGQVGRFTIPNF